MKAELSKEEVYRSQIQLLTYMLAIMAIIIGILIGLVIDVRANEVEEVVPAVEVVEVVEEETLPEPIKRDVMFTIYYPGDKCGSTTKTGKGLTTDQFKLNELGWYTYQGRVVVATATQEGLDSNLGVLANFKEEEPGITYYEYGDELQFEYAGKVYDAIVLDTCGAAMDIDHLNKYTNGLNIIDIFIKGEEYSFGKARGAVIE